MRFYFKSKEKVQKMEMPDGTRDPYEDYISSFGSVTSISSSISSGSGRLSWSIDSARLDPFIPLRPRMPPLQSSPIPIRRMFQQYHGLQLPSPRIAPIMNQPIGNFPQIQNVRRSQSLPNHLNENVIDQSIGPNREINTSGVVENRNEGNQSEWTKKDVWTSMGLAIWIAILIWILAQQRPN